MDTEPLTFGKIEDDERPLAVLVHGFPDTPYTWRHLGPVLADRGYRVVAPVLPGYGTPANGPVNAGTYVRHILQVRETYRGDERAILIGHDWGAQAGYGAVNVDPAAFRRFVSLAIPPVAVLGAGLFSYRQLKRSFYIWFIQQVGLAEATLVQPGFWESLWADWSPGYDAGEDIARVNQYLTAETVAAAISPYRASFNTDFTDPDTEADSAATMSPPPVPTLYLHGVQDGAIGAELLDDVREYLPAAGSHFELIEGVGHFLHLEQPDLIWRKIRAWLDA